MYIHIEADVCVCMCMYVRFYLSTLGGSGVALDRITSVLKILDGVLLVAESC